MLGNIRAQRVGPSTVEALGLPEPFLRRLADRIIRASFEERHRVVVADRAGPAAAAGAPPPASAAGSGASQAGCVVQHEIPPEVRAYRAAIPEERPVLRGYRAPILGDFEDPWPWSLPDPAADPALVRAAELVARRLAADGLVATAAAAVEVIGAGRCRGGDGLRLLRSAGLPIDLLEHFVSKEGLRGGTLVDWIASRIAGGAAAAGLKRDLAGIPMRFTPSCAGFRASAESGEGRLAMLRLQIGGTGYWGGRGAGGGLDVARQLVAALPDLPVVASIERGHVVGFLEDAAAWGGGIESRLRIIPEDLPVSQWAQDNAKAGFVERAGEPPRPMTLVPRYASRGEDGSILIPGETFLADGLAAAGLELVQSPLLFQGGNIMVIREPAKGERVLLIGEAEVYRNSALGLTEGQATEALRLEFGADRLVVLPAAAFHIDYEFCIRRAGGRLLAFVNDTPAAVSIILSCAVDAMERGGTMTPAEAGAARSARESKQPGAVLELVGRAVLRGAVGPGRFSEAFAEQFESGPADSGVGNLQRVLLALDLLSASLSTAATLPQDRHAKAYLESFRRRDADRRVLYRKLEAIGCRIVPVPSLAEGPRGINAVNIVHYSGRVLIPAYGGLFAPLDRAAAGVYRTALGPEIEMTAILCGESQRRLGALHCATSAYVLP